MSIFLVLILVLVNAREEQVQQLSKKKKRSCEMKKLGVNKQLLTMSASCKQSFASSQGTKSDIRGFSRARLQVRVAWAGFAFFHSMPPKKAYN
jgi:hypothetical protein